MKHASSKFLLLLSSSFLLLSCGGEGPGESVSSPDGQTSSSNEDAPIAWGEEDLADMATYLGEGNVLPFALGLTKNYVNASGTDEDGICFIVYDTECGDLTAQYEVTLLGAGFESYGAGEDGVSFYWKEVDEGANELWVQLDVADDGAFEIFAWIEEATPTYETFPYAAINETLGLALSETNLPSFDLVEGELYDGYASEDDTYFYVGGYFDSTIEDDAYIATYEAALTEKGYTVDTDNALAISESASLKVQYMATEGYFFLQLSEYVPSKPGDNAITLTSSDFVTDYGNNVTLTKESVEFRYSSIQQTGGYIQFRSQKKTGGPGTLWNVTSLGKITSIVVTMDPGTNASYYGVLPLYVSSSLVSDDNPGTAVSPTSSGGVYTYAVSTDASFFRLVDETDNASKNASIAINYAIE